MRDPKRIVRILKLVGEIWIKNPESRLCQLLGNCFTAGDIYYVEDAELERRLKEVYLNAKLLDSDRVKKLKKRFEKK